uniref:Uncharacterized protein n=1 Tax=Picea sitchensis TaxID=3332 RepID=A0A6B9XXJ8_PICSI|nr:hypothetical protein Q903MT_gene6817 [Picea sitchensis]
MLSIAIVFFQYEMNTCHMTYFLSYLPHDKDAQAGSTKRRGCPRQGSTVGRGAEPISFILAT